MTPHCVRIRKTSHARYTRHPDTELEEEESSEPNVTQGEHNPGVDDGFFVGIKPVMTEGPANDHHHSDEHPHHGYGPNGTVIPFPYSPGFNPNVVSDKMIVSVGRVIVLIATIKLSWF